MNVKDGNGNDSYCPGYEKLVNEIVSFANIRVESASPTGILVTGCAGVGKSTLVSLLFFVFCVIGYLLQVGIHVLLIIHHGFLSYISFLF